MRYSLIKAAAITFLGLGGFFLGANGTPTSLNATSGGVSSFDFAKRTSPAGSRSFSPRARLPVLDADKNGYLSTNLHTPTSDMGAVWRITKDKSFVDEFGVDPERRMITVRNARNLFDTAAEKLKLRAIILAPGSQ